MTKRGRPKSTTLPPVAILILRELEAWPRTSQALAERVGCTVSWAGHLLRRLYDEGLVHKAAWQSYRAPVFAKGAGVDAPRPPLREGWRKRKARREADVTLINEGNIPTTPPSSSAAQT